MKLLNLLFIIAFTLSAALQYYDDDPYVWIPFYLYGGLLCSLALRRKYNGTLYIADFLTYLSYAIYLFFSKNEVLAWIKSHQAENLMQSMEALKPWI